jgi:hypothetical protein
VVGRQNIEGINAHFVFYPAKWITSFVQYHVFRLADARDALYNFAGARLRRDPTGRAGTNVGQEIDFVTNFHLTNHQDIYFNFSHLFAGGFIKQTGNPRSPEYIYVQYSYRW